MVGQLGEPVDGVAACRSGLPQHFFDAALLVGGEQGRVLGFDVLVDAWVGDEEPFAKAAVEPLLGVVSFRGD